MKIIKAKSGKYYAEGAFSSIAPNIFPEIQFPSQEDFLPVIFYRAVEGLGDLFRNKDMKSAFENWGDFPELHKEEYFFLDEQAAPRPVRQIKAAPFLQYQEIQATAEWIRENA